MADDDKTEKKTPKKAAPKKAASNDTRAARDAAIADPGNSTRAALRKNRR